MRRTEREITDIGFMRRVLTDAQELYLGINAEGAPYVLPVNHVFYRDRLFFHCATEGRKLDLLRADNRVAFSTAVDIRVEKTTTRYRSVCGTGIAEIVEDAALKNEALKAIAAKFRAPCFFPVSPQKFAVTGVVGIRIETLTGKYSRPGEGPRPMPHYER